MCNNELETLCGKTMKELLYKYHMKKCDKCKGNKPLMNPRYVEDMTHNRRGKKLSEMTNKDFKSGILKHQKKSHTIENFMDDKEEVIRQLYN